MSDNNLDPTVVHAVIDGELPAHEHAAALEAVNGDPSASLMYSEYRRLKAAVASLPAVEVPRGTWHACTRRLDELDRNRRAERFVTRYAWALSASVFFLILGAGSWNRLTGQHLGAADVTHMAGLMSSFGSDGNGGKWLQNRVGVTTTGAALPVRLQRVEYGQAGETPMARVTLVDPQGRMFLLVWRGVEPIDGFVPLQDGSLSAGMVLNQNSVAWIQNGYHCCLYGPRDSGTLASVATWLQNGGLSIGSR